MHLTTLLKAVLVIVVLLAVALAAEIAFGGPTSPQPMASINAPFKAVNFSDLPTLLQYKAQDGAALAYRQYAPHGNAIRGSVVLVHGSSASSNSMHVLAKALANAGG